MITGDRLNPIVIKELRQGLKYRSFLLSFIGLQLAMIMSMFFYITSAVSTRGDLRGADVFFWAMLNLLLLLLMPLRGFQALYEELNGKTLELLFLTRMTSWKITFGKWIALVIQSLLMISAILPYFVLRYFLGSIDITQNLFALGGTILGSVVLMAVGVGLSCITSKVLRVLIFLGGALALWFMGVGLFAFMSFGGMVSGGPSSGGLPTWDETLALVIGSVLAIAFFIEYGASRIAPPAENHARWKRAIGFLVLVLFIGVAIVSGDSEILLAPLIVLVPLMVGSLCDPLHRIPGAYKSRLEIPGLYWFLLPGWPSGFLYTLSMLLIHSGTFMILDHDEEVVLFFFMLTNALLFPYVLIRIFKWLQFKPLLSYLAYQVIGLLFAIMLMILNEIGLNTDGVSQFFGVFLPILGMLQIDDIDGIFYGMHIVVALGTTVIAFLLILPGLVDTSKLRGQNAHGQSVSN